MKKCLLATSILYILELKFLEKVDRILHVKISSERIVYREQSNVFIKDFLERRVFVIFEKKRLFCITISTCYFVSFRHLFSYLFLHLYMDFHPLKNFTSLVKHARARKVFDNRCVRHKCSSFIKGCRVLRTET